MMRYWMTTLLVGIGTLTACQLEGSSPESEVSQALGGEHCGAVLPPIKNYKGEAWQPAGPKQTVIMFAAEDNEMSLAALVDYNDDKVVWAAHVPNQLRAKFTTQMIEGSFVGPGLPPDPPCRYPNLNAIRCGEALVARGNRQAQIQTLVEEDIAACQ